LADGIYVGMAAAAARAEQLDAIADNLANVETPGFKASHPAFQSFLPPRAGGRSDKVAAAAVGTGADASAGPVVGTERPLDIVPHEDAFLTVRTATGPAYTRNGKLVVSPDGLLTAAGRPVLGVSGDPIAVPVGATVLVNDRGGVVIDRQEVDRLALVKIQGGVSHLGPSLYGPGAGGAAVPVDLGVAVGQLEMGNATALESTVQMIGAQRQFETAMQAIQTYRRLDDRAIEVGKTR
jgi:flagellar basal-body rod protein FlgF